MILSQQNAPRWFIFIADLLFCFVSFILSYLLRFDFDFGAYEFESLSITAVVLVIVRALSFWIGKSYQGIIRYTESRDVKRIFIVLLTGSIVLVIINKAASLLVVNFNIPRAVILIDFMVSFVLLILFRFSVKELFSQLKGGEKDKQKVVIVGADDLALMSKQALDRDAGTRYEVNAFIDVKGGRAGKTIDGITVRSFKDLNDVLRSNVIHHIILSSEILNKHAKQEIVDIALSNNVRVLDVPPTDQWIKGELSFKQIKKVKIEDLLGRDPIVINTNGIQQEIENKVVLVTGGAGSIGSELVVQLASYQPKALIVFDQAESPLYEVELKLKERFPDLNVIIEIGDVTNLHRMDKVFKDYRPEFIYHAAAYKHVPMMENHPSEAVKVNVQGSKIVADLAVQYAAVKMVLVSTDKAVNPTNVMGASKRIAEIYAQSLNATTAVNFVTTRFGNVLGSNGSVIPRFREQIENGGPITVTHPDITRFFMTIPEACMLILEAGHIGNGGEIFVFDMGESIKIVDLAKKMVKLSRLELGKDIELQFTGLRPGEKLYEELLNNKENTLPTHHDKILIGKVRSYSFEEVRTLIEDLIRLQEDGEMTMLVKKMKEIVPEFKSQNSQFTVLDATN